MYRYLIFVIATLLVTGSFNTRKVTAVSDSDRENQRYEIRQKITAVQNERKQIIEQEERKIDNLKEEFKNKLATRVAEFKEKLLLRAVILNGKVTAKDATSMTVEKDGKSTVVSVTDKTKFARRFWGKSTFSEISVGNMVNVHGKWTDDTKSAIMTSLIRDLSIQKRRGVFVGVVTSISGSTIVLDSVARGTQIVTVIQTTKYVNRKEQSIVLSDIAIGHRIRVKGMWDMSNKTVTDVTQVKDYSLPVLKGTPIPVGSVAPTMTGSPVATPTVSPTISLTPTLTQTPTPSLTPASTMTP